MNKVFLLVLLFTLSFTACEKISDDYDDESPVIDMTSSDASPQNCITIFRGETLEFNAVFKDNIELGSFSIEMHHNFDHHTHSTDAGHCEEEGEEEEKTPVSPFRWIENYTIPSGLKSYTATVSIPIPQGVDSGLYHFMVRLTDAAGWQTFKGISVKIAEK